MADAKAIPDLMDALRDVSVDLEAEPVYVEKERRLGGREWDQTCWHELAIQRCPLLKIDTNCDVFFTLQPQSMPFAELGKGFVKNTLTGTLPTILHGAGPGKPYIPQAFKAIFQ